MNQTNNIRLFYAYFVGMKKNPGPVRIGECDVDANIQPSIPKNCPLLIKIARNDIRHKHPEIESRKLSVCHAELNINLENGKISVIDKDKISDILTKTGISKANGSRLAFLCNIRTIEIAIDAARQGKSELTAQDIAFAYSLRDKATAGNNDAKQARKPRNKVSHPAADALDWSEAMDLIKKLYADGYDRDALLVGSGCFLGLRISDILTLKWNDLLSDTLVKREKKTGKARSLKINPNLSALTKKIIEDRGVEDTDTLIFGSFVNGGEKPITRQRADQILKEAKERYGIKSAKVFSTHTLRKTFGRRVWMQECAKGRGEQALLLLCDVFGHSSVAITKRYLGIRKEEILSVYDTLTK